MHHQKFAEVESGFGCWFKFLGSRGVKIEIETLEHLLFNCNFIAGFWRNILEWWEVKWRPFVDFSDFFFFCNNVSYKGVVKSLWLISVSAACWSAWLARNELVFERRWPKMSNLVFLTKIQALMWIRAVYDELKVNEKIWWVCPVRSWSGGSFWCPPCFGGVKFNIVFFGPCAARESSAAEVGAVCLALEAFLDMRWKGSCSLTIEVGSSEEIESRVSIIGNVSFSKVDKHGNAMAFALAATSLKRQNMFKTWW
ncbi:hypothetical protein ES288_A05G157000v1 [Gossypium darwinii]|uniref:RNase H type-1 domain-containing protein n=1 Tax=Gossypium darwinii TaxID=34276 RepID=A0A5D2GGB4_GOSDA|nr:hypothetical protein ES288_A05G157000v1 [Gossypium darwinii]